MQFWMTVAEVEPAPIDVDSDIVVNVLWAELTTFDVIGMSTHVWAMLEQRF